MHHPIICISTPDGAWPTDRLQKPFATLLDASDPEWSDNVFLNRKITELFDLGCCYYIVFGPESERVHDLIDDVIVYDNFPKHATTTFHRHETIEDVGFFFQITMKLNELHGFLLVNDKTLWLEKIEYIAEHTIAPP